MSILYISIAKLTIRDKKSIEQRTYTKLDNI